MTLSTNQSNLPTIQRFYAEDFKDAPKWFINFLSTANLFTQAVYNVLNQGVDVSQNTKEEIYKFTITNASTTGASNTYNFVPKKFVGAPNGVELGQCLLNSTTGIFSAIGNPVTFDWVYSGGQIKVLAIYGLSAGQSYTVTLRIY